MIRCGKARWDAKDKICAASAAASNAEKKSGEHMRGPEQTQPQPQPQPQTLSKKETDNALAKLMAERAKLDNFWKQE
jgi:hypothetical protein